MRSAAQMLVDALLESENLKDFLKRGGVAGRKILIKPDEQHPGYVLIPTQRGYSNWLKLGEKPEEDIQKRLQSLTLYRKGVYKPGDCFISAWGRFMVDEESRVVPIK